jgi:hypothetical protein
VIAQCECCYQTREVSGLPGDPNAAQWCADCQREEEEEAMIYVPKTLVRVTSHDDALRYYPTIRALADDAAASGDPLFAVAEYVLCEMADRHGVRIEGEAILVVDDAAGDAVAVAEEMDRLDRAEAEASEREAWGRY